MQLQDVPADQEVQQILPGSRDEPLLAHSSCLGSTPTYSSASHSRGIWSQNWQGARSPVPQADNLRWC